MERPLSNVNCIGIRYEKDFFWLKVDFVLSEEDFFIGGGLFLSPTVIEKVLPKRCWTLEYSGELEFSSPFF